MPLGKSGVAKCRRLEPSALSSSLSAVSTPNFGRGLTKSFEIDNIRRPRWLFFDLSRRHSRRLFSFQNLQYLRMFALDFSNIHANFVDFHCMTRKIAFFADFREFCRSYATAVAGIVRIRGILDRSWSLASACFRWSRWTSGHRRSCGPSVGSIPWWWALLRKRCKFRCSHNVSEQLPFTSQGCRFPFSEKLFPDKRGWPLWLNPAAGCIASYRWCSSSRSCSWRRTVWWTSWLAWLFEMLLSKGARTRQVRKQLYTELWIARISNTNEASPFADRHTIR